MRTAIVSDLHLGNLVGSDLVRDADIRAELVAELGAADRVVLLGDTFELRDLPAGEILDLAAPFLEQLGEALGEREVVLVPGNHDHRLAEPLLERRALGRPLSLGLEHRFKPSAGVAARVARMLRPAKLSLAYPGLWIRDGVYAIHGHYLDCHMSIPTVECLSAALTMRMVGDIPDPAGPDDYERATGPIYSLSWGFAQARGPERIGGRSRPTANAWLMLTGNGTGPIRTRLLSSVAFPAAVRGLSRLLRREFVTDISTEGISRAGLAAMRESVRRLQIDCEHLVFGHTHRPGPLEGDEPGDWVQGGARLHATGSWVYSPGLCGPNAAQSLFWPGTVTWVDDDGPPQRRELLADRERRDFAAAVHGVLAAPF
jgi:predicted phosphodiesterase